MNEMLYRTRGELVCHRKDCVEANGELIPWSFALGRPTAYILAVATQGTTYCGVCKPLEGRK